MQLFCVVLLHLKIRTELFNLYVMTNITLVFLRTLLASCLLFAATSVSILAQSRTVLVNTDGTEVSGSWASDERLKTLVRDLHPAVYINEGVVKVREVSPTTLFTDVTSIESIGALAFPSSKIEVVTILIENAEQLSGHIDLSKFSGYGRLKYVHVKSSVDCDTSDLFKMLKNIDAQYRILLTVERPS